MQLSGEMEIAAARQRVWEVVTDPNRVGACLPADPKVEYLDDRHFHVTAEVGNAFMRATATIELELTELSAPARAQAEATAAVMGSPASASGWLTLTELAPESTHLVWAVELELGGILAGFKTMVQGPIQKGIDRTLECLKAGIEAEAASGASSEAAGLAQG